MEHNPPDSCASHFLRRISSVQEMNTPAMAGDLDAGDRLGVFASRKGRLAFEHDQTAQVELNTAGQSPNPEGRKSLDIVVLMTPHECGQAGIVPRCQVN